MSTPHTNLPIMFCVGMQGRIKQNKEYVRIIEDDIEIIDKEIQEHEEAIKPLIEEKASLGRTKESLEKTITEIKSLEDLHGHNNNYSSKGSHTPHYSYQVRGSRGENKNLG